MSAESLDLDQLDALASAVDDVASTFAAYERTAITSGMLDRDRAVLAHREAKRRFERLAKNPALIAALLSRVRGAEQERDAFRDIIRWALGELGDFPARPASEPRTVRPADGSRYYRWYWWRTEMRARFDKVIPATPSPTGGEQP